MTVFSRYPWKGARVVATNRRAMSSAEAVELETLQAEFRRYRHRVAPLPLGETRQLLDARAER